MNTKKTGLLLVNLGTPDSPYPESVRNYLAEFLMDPLVIDLPFPLRWCLVHLFILRNRPFSSSEQYRKVWTEKGSPLLFHTQEFAAGVKKELEGRAHVEMAMRYGNPSIELALESLLNKQIEHLVVLPLYPQYSLAASLSSQRAVEARLKKLRKPISVEFLSPFYNDKAYLDAVATVSRRYLEGKKYDFVLFSFHGLPERQVKRTDQSQTHCFEKKDCSAFMVKENENCYRAQCFHTARELAHRLGIAEHLYKVAFQSRLGRTQWIRPFTDEYYRVLPGMGIKRIAVLCPSFVADCLETVEEVSIRGQEEFQRHGGEELLLVPSLNSEPEWVKAAAKLFDQASGHRISTH